MDVENAHPPDGQETERATEQRINRDLSPIGLDGLRPASLAMGVLFTIFAVYNGASMVGPGRTLLVGCDIALVTLGALVYWACARFEAWTMERVHLAAATLSFSVLTNILIAASVGASPLFTLYLAVLIIASAGSVLYTRWAVTIAAVEVTAWAFTAHALLPRAEFVRNALVVLTSLAAAFIVHVGRVRARARIIELRGGDAKREVALERALEEADQARRGLDRKVGERTAALRTELEGRKSLEEQLRHAQKLEAVGRLAGGVAHDFNNLLTVIRMSMDTLDEREHDPSIQEAIRDAREASDRAAALTHDLLAFARRQTLEREDVPVADILRGVERMVRRVMVASVRLSVDVEPDAGEILADANQIEQVLLNLAINACDAMGDRGALSLTAEALDVDGPEAERRRLTPGPYVRLAVTDTGTGMDEKTMGSIFEPFFTTKEVGRGTGLGLAVAHGIVAQHGGQIEVASAVGKGSTFSVYLPKSRHSAPRLRVARVVPPRSLRNETVLLVEDEPAVRRAVQRTLERLGYRVLPANDGEDALRIAERLEGIDLLLSDVVMPGIDGPGLASALRARWPDLRVLYLTGYSSDRLARGGAMGPTDRVIQKPYHVDDLARTLQGMLAEPAPISRAR